MRPFTPTEVAKYLLWVVLALALTAILVWRLYLTPAHEQIHSGHPGAAVQLRLPEPPHLPSAIPTPQTS